MLKYALFTAVLLPAIFTNAQETVTVSSKVKSATIYLNNAEVHNTASTGLRPGTNYLLFTGLTPFLDANSLRIGSDREITITGINVKTNFMDEADMPQAFRELNGRLKETELNLKIRQSFKKVYEEERDLILQNKKLLGGDSKLTPEDLNDLANIYRTRLKEIEVKIIEIGQEEEKLTKELEKLRAQMGDRNNNLVQNRNEIEVSVYSKIAQTVNFDINYIVGNAGWSPAYEIRTDDNSGSVKMTYKANVFQSTGIDWSEVKLALSTGNPTMGGTQPELQPDYVDYARTREPRALAQFNMAAADGAMAKQEMSFMPGVNVVQGNVNVYFDINQPYNIISSNRTTSVDIQQFNLTADLQYLSIPKLDREVFLMAGIKGWEKLNLIPGPANIYYGTNFVGQSYVNPHETDEKLEVSLGQDHGVVVERKDLNEISKEAGLLGGNKKSFHYKILVKNAKQRQVNIKVEDQMPLSRNKDIIVENENLTGGQLNNETGIISWNLVLQPGESREFELKYSIKYPKGTRIDH